MLDHTSLFQWFCWNCQRRNHVVFLPPFGSAEMILFHFVGLPGLFDTLNWAMNVRAAQIQLNDLKTSSKWDNWLLMNFNYFAEECRKDNPFQHD